MTFVGNGALYDEDMKGKSIGNAITDGASNTIMFVAAGADRVVPWTKPEELAWDPKEPVAALGKLADDFFLAAYCDGSVEAMEMDIDPQTLKARISRAAKDDADRDVNRRPSAQIWSWRRLWTSQRRDNPQFQMSWSGR